MPFEPGEIPEGAKPFAPGESGNPSGRPRGSRNRSTIAKQWLEVSERIKNPITHKDDILEQQDIITLALIKEARSGNVQAYRELMDSAYGKMIDKIEATNTNINIEPTPEEAARIKEALDKSI